MGRRRGGEGSNTPKTSRDACAPEFCQPSSPDKRSEIRERSTSLNAAPGLRFAYPGYEEIKEAERRQTCIPTSARKRRAARAEAQRARLSAFHHGACGSEPTPPLNSSTRFLGPGRGARSRWFERPCAAQRALPAPSCPSPASFSQTGRHAGRAYDPEPPESGGDEPPPAGTALAPPAGVTGWRPSQERDYRM